MATAMPHPAKLLAEPPPQKAVIPQEETKQVQTALPRDIDASDDPWREKVKRWWTQWSLFAHDAMMLDKIQRQNKIVRETVRAARNGTLGKESGDADEPEAESVGVKIGDTVNHNYPPTAAAQSGVPRWAKAAALLAGGAGAGALGYHTLSPINSSEKLPAVPAKQQLDPGGLSIEVVQDPIGGMEHEPERIGH